MDLRLVHGMVAVVLGRLSPPRAASASAPFTAYASWFTTCGSQPQGPS